MLSRTLTQSDVGRPFEYLNPMAIRAYCARSDAKLLDVSRYIQHLRQFRADKRGIFGLKCHFHQFSAICTNERTRVLFMKGFTKHVLIRRKNKVQQAISNFRALSSGVWFADDVRHVQTARLSSLVYSGSAIASSLYFLRVDEQGWLDALIEADVEFLSVYYEDLASCHADVISQVVSYLGITLDGVHPNASTQVLSDNLSLEWEHRFRLEFPDLIK